MELGKVFSGFSKEENQAIGIRKVVSGFCLYRNTNREGALASCHGKHLQALVLSQS